MAGIRHALVGVARVGGVSGLWRWRGNDSWPCGASARAGDYRRGRYAKRRKRYCGAESRLGPGTGGGGPLYVRAHEEAVGEMGSPPTGRPAVVKRRRAYWVTGVRARTESRSLETRGPNAPGSRQTDRGHVAQRPQNAREKKYPKGLDNSGNIEGNSNGLLAPPLQEPHSPA